MISKICNKVKFVSEKSAEEEKQKLKNKYGQTRVYKCDICWAYHLTSNSDRIRVKLKDKSAKIESIKKELSELRDVLRERNAQIKTLKEQITNLTNETNNIISNAK